MKNLRLNPFILVAEDDLDDKFLLETMFKETGQQASLEFVYNGYELLKTLDNIYASGNMNKFPDLILLDLNMPKMDGKEALKKIKDNNVYATIPVVVLSTATNEKEIKDCYELGADSYIVKPSSFNSFINIIESIKVYLD